MTHLQKVRYMENLRKFAERNPEDKILQNIEIDEKPVTEYFRTTGKSKEEE